MVLAGFNRLTQTICLGAAVRNNQPVTQRELELPADAILMSTTDTDSRVTYANAAFVSASGFTLEELLGQPHNLVRHPDMPVEAFADMWATIQGGLPWTAVVKNRRKNGDHYWVRANAAPVIQNGRLTGYASVRTHASRAEIEHAEAFYNDLKAGKAGARKLHRGLVIRTGAGRWRSWLQTASLRARIRVALIPAVPLVLGVGWALGVPGVALAAMTGATALAMLAASAWLSWQVSRPMEQLLKEALDVASGQNRVTSHLNRMDEVGMALRAIGQAGLMFRWVTRDVAQQAISVQAAINEIAQGNLDLSSRTEQAAASVEETASSMEQMMASVKNNAESASLAKGLSVSASEAAGKGGHVVADVVRTMNDISDSSRKISDIIGTIDGIAFQTNILALNAAVEAARAGEQGRGFAVVASEVRNLAQRSADAAKEIKQLIGASVGKVESGTQQVDGAGRAMEEIVSQVQRVSDLIAEISSATQEQSLGIGQVGQGIDHLDQVTQQNAALVEQNAAASESLKQQASRLVDAVGVFR
jgi:aerotaxis receptor